MPALKITIFGWIAFLAVSSAWSQTTSQFKAQTIDDKIAIGYGLAIADVNGDKKPDILLVDKKEVVWYQNPTWEKHLIAKNLTTLDNVCIAAADIDGDGKCEIAVGAGWNPGDTLNSGAVFYLLPPEDRAQLWTPIELHHEPTVHRMWWVNDESGKYSLIVAPLHGRGNKNGQGAGSRLLEYIVPANRRDEWKTVIVNESMHLTHNFDPVQWDGDRSEELLFCGREGVLLLDRQNGAWKSTELINQTKNAEFHGAGEVRLGHFRNDKIIATIEPMHGTAAAVYLQAGDGRWKRHLLDGKLAEGHALACADFLHSGLDQVVAGWRGKDAEGHFGIKLFAPKDSSGDQWESSWVDQDGMACEDLKSADLNGDSWPDIVGAGRATRNVKIYWNQGQP
jgi:hypothetical protein